MECDLDREAQGRATIALFPRPLNLNSAAAPRGHEPTLQSTHSYAAYGWWQKI